MGHTTQRKPQNLSKSAGPPTRLFGPGSDLSLLSFNQPQESLPLLETASIKAHRKEKYVRNPISQARRPGAYWCVSDLERDAIAASRKRTRIIAGVKFKVLHLLLVSYIFITTPSPSTPASM